MGCHGVIKIPIFPVIFRYNKHFIIALVIALAMSNSADY